MMQPSKARDERLPFILFGIVSLGLALGNAEVAAQAITVGPPNPTISVGQPQQFTATGVRGGTAVDVGAFHSCALLQDGTVSCWGANESGQLGDGTVTNASTPVTVAGISGAVAISGGGFHTCARFPDSTLQCWGRNNAGQLGPAVTGERSLTPMPVTGVTATAVSAGGFHTCALPGDGTVLCWGQNDLGQLGNGTVSPTVNAPNPAPASVSGITTAVAVAAGGWHTCALLQDGSIRCWGDNTWGELGNAAVIASNPPRDQQPVTPVPTPVTVSGITTAVAIEAGIFHMCATLRDGALQCWGRGEEGRLGNGSTANSSTPVAVSGITPAAVTPGAEHTCAILQDRTKRCWGDNNFGQLGNGSPDGVVSTIPSAPVTGITAATAASSGAEHTCALLQDGSLQCWGAGNFGRLGNGTITDAFTPVAVTGFGGVTWTSSDTNVATIDANGLATGRNPGSATIIATSGDRSGSTTLTVVSRPTLSLVREGTGSGTVTSSPPGIDCGATCSASYDRNTPVTLTATPATGSIFEGWNGGDCSGVGPCTVALTANTTVFARFTIPRFLLSVTREGTGSGTVASSPPGIDCGATCSASYNQNTPMTLTAAPATGSTFEGWSGGDCSGTGLCTLTLTANTAVFARFGVTSGSTQFTLSVTRAGTGSGTVTSSPPGIDCGATCSASYNQNTPVTLTAAPATGSIFESWNSGDCSGVGPCPVTLVGDTTVVARFTVPSTTRVDFDNPAPPGTTMNGVFQGIDFGTGQWAGSGPYSVNSTNHIYFADSTGTSRTFRFSPAPRVLDSIRVYSVTPGTLTLSDDTGQTLTREVTTGSLQFVTTGWAQPATMVTMSFTNGWDLGVDDITYRTAP